MQINRNTLFYGDNLEILREYIPRESVDLIYLDPPFNSNRSYNVLFKDESGDSAEAQIAAFDDTWHWGPSAERTFQDIIQNSPMEIANLISALRQFIGSNQMMAYLVMMAARLVELHRVLKPTGSLYLHCDPTASHYLKIVMDTIFGIENYRSEITWKRTSAHGNASINLPSVADIILYYQKSQKVIFNKTYLPYSETYLKTFYRHVDSQGRRYRLSDLRNPGYRPNLIYDYKGYKPHPNGWAVSFERMEEYDRQGRLYFPKDPNGRIQLINFLDDMPGMPLTNIWDDIQPIGAQAAERLGYPTQKPLTLLERIIEMSSNPGDLVLDPFSGCGTAIAAAEKLGRRWIGIDITHLAIAMHKSRLREHFNLEANKDYDVVGEPMDLAGARQLAREDRYQFQWWALSSINSRPYGGQAGAKEGKKGSDKGIDGVLLFTDETQKVNQVMVQVKSGKVNSAHIRDLRGVVEREKAAIGVFVTLEEPSSDMNTEAVTSGYYHSTLWQKDYPRIQILTIEDILSGNQIDMPPIKQVDKTFKKAPRLKKGGGEKQMGLLDNE